MGFKKILVRNYFVYSIYNVFLSNTGVGGIFLIK